MRKNIWIGALAIAFVLSLAWGFNQYNQKNDLRITSENQHSRAFNDLASHLDQVETNLAKSRVSTSSNQRVLYLGQVWSNSDAAMKDLAQLPAEQAGLSYVGQFLTQTSDFTRTLAQRVAGGGKIDTKDDKLLSDMHDRLLTVDRKVQELLVRRQTEKLVWMSPGPSLMQRIGFGKAQIAEAAAEGGEGVPANSVRSGLDQLDASLQKLPPFSYTGEFSSRTVPKPLGLPRGEISQSQAGSVARDFFAKAGVDGGKPVFAGESKGPIGGFQWTLGDAYVEVSRNGGVVLMYHNDRQLNERKLTKEQVIKKGMAALKDAGLNLVLTSVEDYGGYLQLEAVAEKSGVRLYPDKARLRVSMDNGQLLALDTTPYWAFHHERNLKKNNAMSLSKAKSKLRPGFAIKESRLAVIAKPGNKEAFSWEFRGTNKGEEYLIYINAQTGAEEKIQRIIKTPRGEYLE